MRAAKHIFHLGIKELISLFRDPVLLFLIAYTFTFSVYTPSKSAVMDVVNASIAIVDEDNSDASRAVRDAMLPPQFLPPQQIDFARHQPGDGPGQIHVRRERAARSSSRTSRENAKPDVQVDHRRNGDEPGRPRSDLHSADHQQYDRRRTGCREDKREQSSRWSRSRRARASTRTCSRAGSSPSTR